MLTSPAFTRVHAGGEACPERRSTPWTRFESPHQPIQFRKRNRALERLVGSRLSQFLRDPSRQPHRCPHRSGAHPSRAPRLISAAPESTATGSHQNIDRASQVFHQPLNDPCIRQAWHKQTVRARIPIRGQPPKCRVITLIRCFQLQQIDVGARIQHDVLRRLPHRLHSLPLEAPSPEEAERNRRSHPPYSFPPLQPRPHRERFAPHPRDARHTRPPHRQSPAPAPPL